MTPQEEQYATDLPNKTFTKAEFTPWEQIVFDANDTVDQSGWYDEKNIKSRSCYCYSCRN